MQEHALPRLRRRPSAHRRLPGRPAPSVPDWPETGFNAPLRAARRIIMSVLWTAFAAPVQAVLIAMPGRGKIRFARLYWAGVSRLMGLSVRVIGTQARARDGRQVVFVANHASWVDIPALGGVLEACFVSKDEVAGWPVIGTIARLGRTVYVSRRTGRTGQERDEMRRRLGEGDNLLLFPEGTSSDGTRVLPFRSPFFAVAEGEDPPLIQPVSVAYDRLAGLPLGRKGRHLFAWYGDMDLAPHAWRLAQWRGLGATVLLHPPIDPRAFASRKALAQAVWQVVADGAGALRQHRPPSQAADPAPTAPALPEGEPALAA